MGGGKRHLGGAYLHFILSPKEVQTSPFVHISLKCCYLRNTSSASPVIASYWHLRVCRSINHILFWGENKVEICSTKVTFFVPHYGRISILHVKMQLRGGFCYSTCWLMWVCWLRFHVWVLCSLWAQNNWSWIEFSKCTQDLRYIFRSF